MTNMHFGESLTRDENVNNSMDLLLTRNLLMMSTQGTESLLLQSFRSSNGIITNIWTGSLFVEMMTSCIYSKKATTRGFAYKTSKTCCFFCIVIQRCMEDLQLGVRSYQKKLNLTRPETYRSDLKRLPTYSAYPNPRGFIYQNKDKKNKLIRIDELHKFSDGTLNYVRTVLDDILKRIRMKYLPQTYWRNVDKERAEAMI
ncbi:hypothetical protein Tco_1243578 [Tanacetum coccineum]